MVRHKGTVQDSEDWFSASAAHHEPCLSRTDPLEERIARSFVFVEPKLVIEEIVEETEDVEIMKPQLGARSGKRISRKRLAEKPFVVRPVFDLQTVCVSADALLAESSIPEHKMFCTTDRS